MLAGGRISDAASISRAQMTTGHFRIRPRAYGRAPMTARVPMAGIIGIGRIVYTARQMMPRRALMRKVPAEVPA